jgi:hypothetical protein
MTAALIAGVTIGGLLYWHYNKLPGTNGKEISEVLGSTPMTATTKVPNVDKQSEGVKPQTIDAVNAQIANYADAPKQTAVMPQTQSAAYADPVNSDHFGVLNAEADYAKVIKDSEAWHRRRPATISLTRANRGDPSKQLMPMIANVLSQGRAEQYAGVAVTTKTASIPVVTKGHGKQQPSYVKHPADLARAEKSAHHKTLKANTMPPVGMDRLSAHLSTNPHTQIKTGRIVRHSK